MTDARAHAVERFYDFHPINARQILDAVAACGIAPDAITEEVLQQHDQDHYGGTAATDRLIGEAAVRAEDVVLDVCSGMGGPARYLAWKTGCDVTGLDLTASRVEGATELTRVAGLSASVRFVHGNALGQRLQQPPAGVGEIVFQWAHVPERRLDRGTAGASVAAARSGCPGLCLGIQLAPPIEPRCRTRKKIVHVRGGFG